MNVLWVFAHPDQASLSGVLRDEGVRALVEAGHEVRMSDLYAMKWKAVVDRDDFPEETASRTIAAASRQAYDDGTLSADIRAEQEKLRWADTVVLQFPLWWYSMPAIMKGWVDRVFVKGFGYGVSDPSSGRTLRYGEGVLAGKRALVVLTAGSREPAFGPRGINGQLDLALFPLLHGTLWYTGMDVLPPVAIYGADRVNPAQLEAASSLVRSKVLTAGTDAPLPYRTQNGGDYDSDLVLLPHHSPDSTGLGVHYHSV
ncbi:NAD(P)H-dependent oxidoreductase [Amycolatopsis sp. 195334CR]|uniref:NAD(P)H-dependent oxidoreductase n=1 Tax=Amycolatopsis sp. 195334CR TaxID=2814588 RepID=UPI001A901612|nr:NAD(P)H-dependent oxidoreductase [Amycolatopsis sp. 195334CR]MBN6041463.1 NAD(P)H-dependent oxidoreductase [Amycolatopsis sp. 195334CR]